MIIKKEYSGITIELTTNSIELYDVQLMFLDLFVAFLYEHHIRTANMNGFDEFPQLFSYHKNPRLYGKSNANNNF